MRIVAVTVMVVGVFAGGLATLRAGQTTESRPASAASRPSSDAGVDPPGVVAAYCAGCHNGSMRSPSGVLLDQFDPARVADNRDAWARAYRQLQAGTMPPVGAPRPDRPAYHAVLRFIAKGLGADVAPAADATSAEIAQRLAALLWDSAPDASLLQAAQRNQLVQPATLERQIGRMLADERAQTFVARFFVPWLGLDRLAKADPDTKHFPDYDPALKDALARETELFVLGQLRDNRDPIDLWRANESFLNEQLARHYGIAGVTGPEFRRVAMPAERSGLLGQGSVLMATSRHQHGPDAGYTSPASRAMWVRLRFLGVSPPNAFPGAQPVKPELPITPQTRALPAQPCVNCHRNFFPLGYALENFDPIGRWRTSDQAGPVDASGAFVDGTPTNGVIELRRVLLQYPDAFRMTITEKLLLFASGKPATTRVSTESLIRARQALHGVENARWSSIIAAIVRSKPLTETVASAAGGERR